MNNNITNQIELTLNTTTSVRPSPRQCGSHRLIARGAATMERAAWWFGKMRAAVDQAAAWSGSAQPQKPNQPALV